MSFAQHLVLFKDTLLSAVGRLQISVLPTHRQDLSPTDETVVAVDQDKLNIATSIGRLAGIESFGLLVMSRATVCMGPLEGVRKLTY